jgi:hypothetical protein
VTRPRSSLESVIAVAHNDQPYHRLELPHLRLETWVEDATSPRLVHQAVVTTIARSLGLTTAAHRDAVDEVNRTVRVRVTACAAPMCPCDGDVTSPDGSLTLLPSGMCRVNPPTPGPRSKES